MTTGAKPLGPLRMPSRNRRSGQSLLEFAFLVPVFVGLIQILIQVEIALSMSIVNQKHTRGALQHLLFNHRSYMELRYAYRESTGQYKRRFYVMMDNRPSGGSAASSDLTPEAPVVSIGNYTGANNDANTEFGDGVVVTRQKVRIRSTASICLPPIGVNGEALLAENNLGEDTFSAGNYAYCRD
jgi:hypothetical protein